MIVPFVLPYHLRVISLPSRVPDERSDVTDKPPDAPHVDLVSFRKVLFHASENRI